MAPKRGDRRIANVPLRVVAAQQMLAMDGLLEAHPTDDPSEIPSRAGLNIMFNLLNRAAPHVTRLPFIPVQFWRTPQITVGYCIPGLRMLVVAFCAMIVGGQHGAARNQIARGTRAHNDVLASRLVFKTLHRHALMRRRRDAVWANCTKYLLHAAQQASVERRLRRLKLLKSEIDSDLRQFNRAAKQERDHNDRALRDLTCLIDGLPRTAMEASREAGGRQLTSTGIPSDSQWSSGSSSRI